MSVSDTNVQKPRNPCVNFEWICLICCCSVGYNEPIFTWFISVSSLSPAWLLAQQSFRWLVTMCKRRGWCCVWRPTTKSVVMTPPPFKRWAWLSRYHLIRVDGRNPLLLALAVWPCCVILPHVLNTNTVYGCNKSPDESSSSLSAMGGTERWSDITRPQLGYEHTLQRASSGLPQLMQSSLGGGNNAMTTLIYPLRHQWSVYIIAAVNQKHCIVVLMTIAHDKNLLNGCHYIVKCE